jgi:hypothetical protein
MTKAPVGDAVSRFITIRVIDISLSRDSHLRDKGMRGAIGE